MTLRLRGLPGHRARDEVCVKATHRTSSQCVWGDRGQKGLADTEVWTQQGSPPGRCRGPGQRPAGSQRAGCGARAGRRVQAGPAPGTCVPLTGLVAAGEAEHLATGSLSLLEALPGESRERRAQHRLGRITCSHKKVHVQGQEVK